MLIFHLHARADSLYSFLFFLFFHLKDGQTVGMGHPPIDCKTMNGQVIGNQFFSLDALICPLTMP